MPICAYIRRNGQLSKCGPRESFCLFTSTQWKNFHSLFLRDARPGARFNQQPHCCIVCLLWRGAGRGGAGRMYAAPSRFYIGARNGNGQHELVVSCRSSPRPRRAGSISKGCFPRAALTLCPEPISRILRCATGRGCVKRHTGFPMSMRCRNVRF